MQGEVRTVGRERWTLASGGRIMAVRSQVSCFPCYCFRHFQSPVLNTFRALFTYCIKLSQKLFTLARPTHILDQKDVQPIC